MLAIGNNVGNFCQHWQTDGQGDEGIVKIALGRKGDYSVRAVLDLAIHYGRGRRKAQEIAAAMQIPRQSLTRILADLVRSGLITATAGPDGGYRLQRPPSKVHLLDVVEAAEGEVSLNDCILRGIPCGSRGTCAVHKPWSEAQAAMLRRLRKTTFAQIVREEASRDE
jgi:Rrf2 family protein